MSASLSAREEALAWIAKAEQHLLSARILRDAHGPAATGCFLCQQAAETALKALIVSASRTPPRSHDLVLLYEAIEPEARPSAVTLADLARWGQYAVAPRYPGFGDDHAETEFPASVDAVGRLVDEARAQVERSG